MKNSYKQLRIKEKQLDAIINTWARLKIIKDNRYFSQLSPKAKELFEEIKKEKNTIDLEKLVCVKTDGTIFGFTIFKKSLDLASDIYQNGKASLEDPEDKQYKMSILLSRLNRYSPTKPEKITSRKEAMSAATKLFNNRKEVIEAFKTGIFPYIDGFQIEEESEEESVKKSTKDDLKKFSR